MKKAFVVAAAAIVLLCLGVAAQAITIETVAIGDAGNAPDTLVMIDGTTGYGSVSYNYNIGKYEVTAGQYTAFLNAVGATDTYGLYSTGMSNTSYGSGITRSGVSGSYTYSVASAFVNRPVNYVSYWNSCRFANWLGNGQLTGAQDNTTTEDGAYTLGGYNDYDGRTIGRNAGATWAVTSEDEWYKAAYYKGGGTNAGYWLYPTSSDTAPGQDMADASGNNANYYTAPYALPIDSGKYTTVVGEFQNSDSPYGTFDQGGNVWEWNEAIPYISVNYACRGLRGGSFSDYGSYLQSSYRYYSYPSYEHSSVGFRVSVAVPAYGISNRAAYHPIISTACTKFNFRVWGKVTILISGNSFTVDDGSGAPVKVVAPGFSGIQDGDHASAKGAFSGEGSIRVLNSQASDVVKLH